MAFTKGQSGNPGGRPKTVGKVRKLARKHTADAIRVLAEIMSDDEQHPAARVAAAKELLDRGHGKPMQAVEHSGAIEHKKAELSPDERLRIIDRLRAEGSPEVAH